MLQTCRLDHTPNSPSCTDTTHKKIYGKYIFFRGCPLSLLAQPKLEFYVHPTGIENYFRKQNMDIVRWRYPQATPAAQQI